MAAHTKRHDFLTMAPTCDGRPNVQLHTEVRLAIAAATPTTTRASAELIAIMILECLMVARLVIAAAALITAHASTELIAITMFVSLMLALTEWNPMG